MKQITVSVIDPVGLHLRSLKLLFPAMVMTKMLQSLQSKKYCALRKSSVNKRERLRAQSC